MNIWDLIKIIVKSEGFTGVVVGLIAVGLALLNAPKDVVTAILAVATLICAAIVTWVSAARIRARMW